MENTIKIIGISGGTGSGKTFLTNQIKEKFGGSDAGHNGVASIDKFIGKDYSRIRVGIGRPETKTTVSDYVLKDFNEDEQEQMEEITSKMIEYLSILIDKKLDLFSSTVNNK